jgi:hypothetical protein
MNDKDNDQPPKIQWVKSPHGVCEVYANMMHITWSLDDIRIRLAQLVESPATPNPGPDFVGAAEERAAVTLSWRSAKILRDQLVTAIENFENTNGTINVDVTLPPTVP